jgi:membrane-associated phospholipid phosphatase
VVAEALRIRSIEMPDRPITDTTRVGVSPAVPAAGAVLVAFSTIRGPGRALDNRLFAWANGRLRHPALDLCFRVVTELGSLWASVAAAAALAWRGRRREAADALGAAATMWLLGQALKRAFRRLRPYEADLPGLRLLIRKPHGASWPSSHPAVLITFVTVAARDLDLPGSWRRGLTGLAGVVGWSRVSLGAHYPADVLGGLLLGKAVADAWSRSLTPRVLH